MGAYLMVEQEFSKSISGFFRYGLASTSNNNFGSCTAAGLKLSDTFDREGDSFGVGITSVNAGKEFIDSSAAAGEYPSHQEITYELTYRYALQPWLILQPDYQYVSHPVSSTNSYAQVGTFRVEASF